jgi:arylsulfatase A-like enzyme
MFFMNSLIAILAGLFLAFPAWAQTAPRPNILWITCEDTGPQLGAYGDTYAQTPHLDRLAQHGMIYRHVWANAPVCAPARTTIISGLYPNSTGAEHMRSQTRLPAGMKMFPCILREAGYYCSNNSKEDYNLEKTGLVWDESSNQAHWKKRQPDQPFFAVFNHVMTHESQVRKRPHTQIHDPSRVRVPAYHPDAPEVRQDWAQYYDLVTQMDEQAGRNLAELELAGLAEDTIVFFFGDHGPGMPRCKRWPYNSGLGVALIVYIPEKFRHLASPDYRPGGQSERLISFVDLAPTVLSLAGIKPPAYMQGQAFLGRYFAPPRHYVYGFRGRMDERYDLVRSVFDGRYVYVHHYMPHLIYGQHVNYMFQTPTTQVWKQRYDAGLLQPPQTFFWETKPTEELYDLAADPDEVVNLADRRELQPALKRLRRAEEHWIHQIRDVGFLPENEIHERSAGSTPYEMGHDPSKHPLDDIWKTARTAAARQSRDLPQLRAKLNHRDSAVRYWAVLGLGMQGQAGVAPAWTDVRKSLQDPAPPVSIVAAEILVRYGSPEDAASALTRLRLLASPKQNGIYVSMQALNAIDHLGDRASSLRDYLKSMDRDDAAAPARSKECWARLLEKILDH